MAHRILLSGPALCWVRQASIADLHGSSPPGSSSGLPLEAGTAFLAPSAGLTEWASGGGKVGGGTRGGGLWGLQRWRGHAGPAPDKPCVRQIPANLLAATSGLSEQLFDPS